MYTCEVCGKKYKREYSYRKHLETHNQPVQQQVDDTIEQMAEAMKFMQQEILSLRAQLEGRESPEESRAKLEKMRMSIAEKQARKLESIQSAPLRTIRGVGDDYNEPEVVRMCGKTWVIPIGKQVKLPEPVVLRALEMRQLRKRRDEVARRLSERSFSKIPRDLDELRDTIGGQMAAEGAQ